MITIQQKRIINISAHLPQDFQGKDIVVGVLESQVTKNQIERIGLSFPVVIGETILPSAIGPITRFNAQGKEVPLQNKPMETHYRDMEFTRHEWHGQDRVEVTDCVWIPYKKYPRKIILPPSFEISVTQNPDLTIALATKPLKCIAGQFDEIGHAINVFLEIFGVCNVYIRGQSPHVIPVTKRLNWKLLPPGELPWKKLKAELDKYHLNQRPKTFAAALNRFEKIAELKPDFTAIGQGGYQGYVVFGFSSKNIFVLESQHVNNAIYIFDNNWPALSQLTKSEILSGQKQIARIIHGPNWYAELLKHLV